MPAEDQITAALVWPALVGQEYGSLVRVVLSSLATVPPSVLVDAIDRIEHETTIGPLLDPTAYLGGQRFENARDYQDVLLALHSLRLTLQRSIERTG